MTYSSNKKGEGFIALTPEENEAFKRGQQVTKYGSGDSRGMFVINLKLVRPRSRAKRFPFGRY